MEEFNTESSMESQCRVPTEPSKPVLPVSLSSASSHIASQLNRELAANVQESQSPGKPHTIVNIANTTIQLDASSLTSVTMYDEAVKQLVDHNMKEELESQHVINWLPSISKLLPIKTMGDGNCLLHALALAIWGLEDSSLLLRRLLYIALVQDEDKGRIKKRWQSERRWLDSNIPGGGLRLNTGEWETEWNMIVKAAEDLRQEGHVQTRPMYECLEEVHVFVMANILKRPIIVASEPVVRGFSGCTLAPNNFGGMYLPLLWRPEECLKSPIILGFSSNHFAPLIKTKGPNEAFSQEKDVWPIVNANFEALHVHFLLPHEESSVHNLYEKYLHFDEVKVEGEQPPRDTVPVVHMDYCKPPASRDLVAAYFNNAQQSFKKWIEERKKWKLEVAREKRAAEMRLTKSTENTEVLKPPILFIPQSIKTTKLSEKQNENSEEMLISFSSDPGAAASTPTTPQNHPKVKNKCSECGKYAAAREFGGLCSVCYTNEDELITKGGDVKVEESSEDTNSLTLRLQTLLDDEREVPMDTREDLLGSGKAQPKPMYEELSMIGERCRTEGCTNYSSKNTYPFCHEHKNNSYAFTTSPGSPMHESTKTKPMFPRVSTSQVVTCNQPGCQNASSPKLQGYCAQCYVLRDTKQEKPIKKCRIPACPGEADEDYDNYCRGCFLREPVVKTAPQMISISSSLDETRECVAPACSNLASSANNGLCDECYSVLLREKAAPNKVPRENVRISSKRDESIVNSNQPSECKTAGCQMYGTPAQHGYCSQCFKRNSTQYTGAGIIQHGSGNTLYIQPEPVVVEHGHTPALCKNHHCDLIGDPYLDGYCSRCYREVRRGHPSTLQRHHSLTSSIPRHQLTQEEERYRLTLSEPSPHSGSRRHTEERRELDRNPSATVKKCLNCSNFGNPRKRGYCNSCATELSRANLLTGYDECD